MSKNIIGAIIVLLVAVAGYMFYKSPAAPVVVDTTTTQTASTTDTVTGATTSPVAVTPVKFADQDYAQFAYQIDPNNIGKFDDKTKLALTGFNVASKKNADGTVTVSLTSTNKEYHDQSYTLKTGDKLYFIEKNLKDDDEKTGEDKYLQDDTAVVVDKDGNVVQQ